MWKGKDALHVIFNHLTMLSKKVYLQPNRSVMELYVLSLNEAIIVKPLVSEAPLRREGKITTSSPEKMLVDIVAEPDIFVAQQGELESIFENCFSQYACTRTGCCGMPGGGRERGRCGD
ncbi:MAG: hypothetical protein IPN33_03745 [Saprospiraceae bacterium]|nr:hypothetical protein [Saprospiraceae bacterium]